MSRQRYARVKAVLRSRLWQFPLKQGMATGMHPNTKPTPLRFCEHCSAQLIRKRWTNGVLESLLHFGRRKFCDQRCMGHAFDARPTTGTSWATTHYHARKLVDPGPCTRCGALDALDVHHRDGDHQNNLLENLERICRSCHNKEHQKKASCTICGLPQKGHGYCSKHLARVKRHGDPMAVKVNQHRPVGRSAD